MPASRLHLVRHGEVFNPEGVLYERLDGFKLSDRGHEMARAAAQHLADRGVRVGKLVASPLLRTQQSAAPIAELFGLEPILDERVIEPWNEFRGLRVGPRAILRRPSLLLKIGNPAKPSWGEPFVQIAQRMTAAALDHYSSTEGGDLVIVSHQLPIWMVYRSANGLVLPHSPASRRCSLSSITSFEVVEGKLKEVDYAEPGLAVAKAAIDGGAV
jgi:broad specificity phosphatase PhoE